ncbi:hypothetical protein Mapa_006993 [Marchantia paleacea]|nr:hypothetical protein Mapa_006993 [Marchantia paleacea]
MSSLVPTTISTTAGSSSGIPSTHVSDLRSVSEQDIVLRMWAGSPSLALFTIIFLILACYSNQRS